MTTLLIAQEMFVACMGHGWPSSPSIEAVIVLHVALIDTELSDMVPARVAASLQAEFERDYREARRGKVRSSRERKQRDGGTEALHAFGCVEPRQV